MTRGWILIFFVVASAIGALGGCGRRSIPVHRDLDRAAWPFQMIEIYEARGHEFPGSTPEKNQYGEFFVSTTPFLATTEVDRLECVDGKVVLYLNDHGAREFARRTTSLSRETEKGRIAIYTDGKLLIAAAIAEPIKDGHFQLADYKCEARANSGWQLTRRPG
jgi:hypothetical protein